MQIKTRELEGAALDWAVAQTMTEYMEGFAVHIKMGLVGENWAPPFSTDWSQGGPLIEQYKVKLTPITQKDPTVWHALTDDGQKLFSAPGPTPLVAAMRALVAARLGEVVEVPDELMEIA